MTVTQATNEIRHLFNSSSPQEALLAGKVRARLLNDFLAENPGVMNSNTISTELKRATILQEGVVEFARRLLVLTLFSTVFKDVVLQGSNKVEVAFYDLDSSASASFDPVTGYGTLGNTNTSVREIEVGTAASNNHGGRLFQSLGFSSEEIARQPYLNIKKLAMQKIEKLASDVLAHILGVVTAANYGAAAITKAAALFDSDDLANLKLACKLWPDNPRGLVLDSDYDAALLKDGAFKSAMNAASDSAIKEGKLFPRVSGFDYAETPTIPDNGENLKGFAVHPAAVLVAFAPVPPADAVRKAGTSYEIAIEPRSGVILEYRTFGIPTLDTAAHIIESSFGWAKGNANALKRIVSA